MKKRLNTNLIERFSRQIILKDVGVLGQKKILSSKVLIVGAGGTAQSIIPSLLANNVGQIFLTNRSPNNAIKLKEQYLHLTEIE